MILLTGLFVEFGDLLRGEKGERAKIFVFSKLFHPAVVSLLSSLFFPPLLERFECLEPSAIV